MNAKWRLLFLTSNIQHLPHSMSDHCSLILNTKNYNAYVGSPTFKFEAWWIMEETLEKDVEVSWESTTGSLEEKIERLQADLKVWTRVIKKGREGLKQKLMKELKMLLVKERTDETMERIVDTKIHLNMEIDKDEAYWEQRARVNWLKAWDKNTNFFHRFASFQKRINTISKLELDGGGEATEVREINEVATLFFQKLFTSIGVGDLSYLLSDIENKISRDNNSILLSTFIEEEVFTT